MNFMSPHAPNRCWRLLYLYWFSALLVLVSLPHSARGQDGYALRDILRAWQARQDKFDTARVELTVTRVHPKGTLPAPKLINPRKPVQAKPPPGEDASVDSQGVLVLARGGKMRFEYTGKVWVESIGQFLEQTFVSTFDGYDNKTFFGKGTIGGDVHPNGYLNKARTNISNDSNDIKPFVLLFRPLDPTMGGYPKEGWKLRQERGIIDGHPCLLLERPRESRGFTDVFWIDPARDFIVLRTSLMKIGTEEVVRLNCTYDLDPEYGWIPSSWNATVFDRGQATHSSLTARTLRYEFNKPLEDKDFQFAFPPGSEVLDEVNDQLFVQLKGGRVRYITKAERMAGLDYKGVIAESFYGSRWRWVSVGVVAAAGATVLVLYMRRLRRRSFAQ